MQTLLTVVMAVMLLTAMPAVADRGYFRGITFADLDMDNLDCPPSARQRAQYRLRQALTYVDSNEIRRPGTGREWHAPEQMCTDGATIPDIAFVRWAIGHPLDPDILPAAVIHDRYCDTQEIGHRDTHWVFYDALLASGVAKSRAQIMYFAVLIGGPRWSEVTTIPMQLAGAAERDMDRPMIGPLGLSALSERGYSGIAEFEAALPELAYSAIPFTLTIRRDAQFDAPEVVAAIDAFSDEVLLTGRIFSEEEIQARADEFAAKQDVVAVFDGPIMLDLRTLRLD